MPITIRDIAKKLGISITAVSRALDGYPDISEETRQRVIDAARVMGYVPNRAARQLRRQKSDAIGYILSSDTPRFSSPFFSEFLVGLGDESAIHPFDLLVSIAPPGAEAEQTIYRNWVQSRKVDGLILDQIRSQDWRVRFLEEHDIPFVGLELSRDGIDYPRVEVHNLQSMAGMVAHLVENGFQRIAFIGGPKQLIISTQRLAGYRRGLRKAGLPIDPALIQVCDLTTEGAYEAVKRLRWLTDPPDAVMCISDETAFGAIRAVHELGFQVGKDIAVTGFNGVAASAHTDPPLTTLDIPVSEIGRKLVSLLAAELENRPLDDRRIIFTPRLLKRASSGDSTS
ncbi:MAG: LacI family transcriptional regulator [Anaerolineae bacterium]|nr:LacI family transcriptional regulator [Anaerolineae bacterium]